jgi:glycosyltransferase involved in cell wall biosynthesis
MSQSGFMKIEIVSFTGDSGLADYAVSLARALNQHHQVALVTAQSLPARFDTMGFEIHRVFRRSRHFPVDVIRFVRGVVQRRPDAIIVQGPLKYAALDTWVVRYLRRYGIRCLLTIHDVLPHYPKPWSPWEYRGYYQAFDQLIVHSEAAAQAVKALGVHKPLLVVPHGIYDIFNLNQLNTATAKALFPQLPANKIWVLFFGNLEPRKGLLEFIHAAKTLAATGQFQFIMAGANHWQGHGAEINAAVAEARNLPNVLVQDARVPFEKVEAYFAAADIIALPYREGTTSGVLKLALAFGKPVVASRVGDFPEQVPAGAGIFINPDHLADEFCHALTAMAEQLPAYTQAMQNSANLAQWPDIARDVSQFLVRAQHA